MNFIGKRVEPSSPDYKLLIKELNRSLLEITNDSGESSFSLDEIDIEEAGFMVVYLDSAPVACGSFRKLNSITCEFKRMYSKQPGAGRFLIKELEIYAKHKGYFSAVLSTRRINSKAVNYYQRNSYSEIKPYGKYVGRTQSICMGKKIAN